MEKKNGYALLWGGVGIILYSVFMAYRVFNGIVEPPILVDLKSIILPLPNMPVTMPLDPQISKTINISIYFMFLLFVASAGNKIGGLGIKMLRPEKPEAKKTEPLP
jgi:hypothetical protein